jgi:putative FmdB family regulatory protein
MPLYEFYCPDCQREQEHLVRGQETPRCESCGGERLSRLLSIPAAHTAGDGARSPDRPTGSCGSGCGCFPG